MKGLVRLICELLVFSLLLVRPSYFNPSQRLEYNIQIGNLKPSVAGYPRTSDLCVYFLRETACCSQESKSVYPTIMSSRRAGSASAERAVQKDICPICNIKITQRTHSLSCEICGMWYCLKCTKVPQAVYDALVEASGKFGSLCVFLCPCCKPSLPVLTSINQTVNDIKTSTSERFDNLETKVTDLEQNMGRLITRDEVDSMKQELKDEAASDFEKILERKLKERDEISKRELNLIFWGVPESTSEDTGIRRSHDSDFILRVGRAIGVQDIKFTQVIRIGPRPKKDTLSATKGKPRGILVKFLDKSQRRDVLRGSKNLQSCEDDLSSVSITKDLTFSQRQDSKTAREAIRKEFDERVKNGEKNIKLRGRRIIKVRDNSESDSEEGEGHLSTSLTLAMSKPF